VIVATAPFDGASEVGGFLDTMVSTGWPVFLALAGGLVAITLAALGVRSVFRRLTTTFVGLPPVGWSRFEPGDDREYDGDEVMVTSGGRFYRNRGNGDPWGL